VTNPFIAMFASEPALVAPEMRNRFVACLDALAASRDGAKLLDPSSRAEAERASGDDGFWLPADHRFAAYRPYVVKDGILHIPVKGVLLHDFPWAIGSWVTGYDYIWRAFERGCRDEGVRAIALIEDTPGGMVAGCFDAVDRMMAAKVACGKPVRSFAMESAYSAGYAIFAIGDEGWVSRTGGVGSVGVVTGHIDVSEAMKQDGVKFTFIFAGAHKVDGNPFEALPADVKKRIQVRINELYGIFVASVARCRPKLDEAAIRATEALTFTASQAVSNGFADKIGSLDDALAAFAADLSSPQGDDQMSTCRRQRRGGGADGVRPIDRPKRHQKLSISRRICKTRRATSFCPPEGAGWSQRACGPREKVRHSAHGRIAPRRRQ
jgi:ClpP class serine protease